jgi:hypothetical protein
MATEHPKLVSDEEAEQCDYVVCVRVGTPSHFTDDETGVCAHCGHAIFWRPSMPKRPPKICIQCMLDIERAGHG